MRNVRIVDVLSRAPFFFRPRQGRSHDVKMIRMNKAVKVRVQ